MLSLPIMILIGVIVLTSIGIIVYFIARKSPCKKSCDGKDCGASDGCGGTCMTGYCAKGKCVNGKCGLIALPPLLRFNKRYVDVNYCKVGLDATHYIFTKNDDNTIRMNIVGHETLNYNNTGANIQENIIIFNIDHNNNSNPFSSTLDLSTLSLLEEGTLGPIKLFNPNSNIQAKTISEFIDTTAPYCSSDINLPCDDKINSLPNNSVNCAFS